MVSVAGAVSVEQGQVHDEEPFSFKEASPVGLSSWEAPGGLGESKSLRGVAAASAASPTFPAHP